MKSLVWQTAVSSKLAIEDGVKKVLCEYSKAKISKVEVLEGLVNAYVKFVTKLIYINLEGNIKSKAFEIEVEASSECAYADLDTKYIFSSGKVLDEEFSLNGENDATASAVLEVCVYLNKPEKIAPYTEKDEHTYLKADEYVISTLSNSGEYKTEVSCDLKVKDDVKEIILTDSRAIVKSVENRKGILVASGEVYTKVCYLTNDEVPAFRTAYALSDFNEEIISSSEELFDSAHANCDVVGTTTSISEREINVKADIKLSYAVFEKNTINLTTDAYNVKNKLKLNYGKSAFSKISEVLSFKDEITAEVKLPASEDNKVKINSVIEKDILLASSYIKEGELVVEGLGGFTVLYDEISIELETKTLKSVDTTVPFSFKFKAPDIEYDKLICEVNFKNADAKLTRDEAEVSCDVEIVAVVMEKSNLSYLESVSVTSETYEEPASISLYVAGADDNLWSIGKKLRLNPDELLAQNKELENEVFPGQQVVIYRKR